MLTVEELDWLRGVADDAARARLGDEAASRSSVLADLLYERLAALPEEVAERAIRGRAIQLSLVADGAYVVG